MIQLSEMVQAGMHFGHQARRWNPRMSPYIYGERNGVHIIDLIQTHKYLTEISEFVTEQTKQGKTFLFVGTKNQADELIQNYANQHDTVAYVNHRWLGGMLTNWKTIRTSINALNQYEKDEASGQLARLPKKEAALKRQQQERLVTFLGGLKKMTRLPDIVVIIGQTEELNAVRECRKLGLRSITVLDTDCDPKLADLFIPANDDSVTSIDFILKTLSQAITAGEQVKAEKAIS